MALDGKVAVVTGAAMGIGKAMAEILLQKGAKVALLDVNSAAGTTVKDAFDKHYGLERTFFIYCDVQSEEQIKDALKKTVETFGGIDIICNNAGIFNESEWEKTISINLLGLIRVTYLALEYMNKLTGGRGGVIINIASMAGLMHLKSGPSYTASKHGVIGFTRSMAGASAASGYGIRVNAICPGFVATNLFSTILDNMGAFSHLADQAYLDSFKILNVSQVAEAFLQLVMDETKNGEALMVTSAGKNYMTFPEFK